MGLLNFHDAEELLGRNWLLHAFQQHLALPADVPVRYTPNYEQTREELHHEYWFHMFNKICVHMRHPGSVYRKLDRDPTLSVKLPRIRTDFLMFASDTVKDLYYQIHEESMKMKQLNMNEFAEIEHFRFLTQPASEFRLLTHDYDFSDFNDLNDTNNEASRKSRNKKRLELEMTIEHHNADYVEAQLHDQEERMMHAIIVYLEDKLYESTGDPFAVQRCRENNGLF